MAETKPNAAAKATTSVQPKGSGNAISYLAPIICLIAGYCIWRFILGNPDSFTKPDLEGGFWPSHKGPKGAWNRAYEGGIIVPLLIGCFLMVITFSIERFLTIKRATGAGSIAEFVRKVQFHLANKNVDAALSECDKQKGSVGNVMKAPVHSKLMLACYTEAAAEVNENNTDWHKPIEILNKYVFENNLQQYVYPYISNHDDWNRIVGYVVGNDPIPEQYYFIHWMNEEWRSRDIDKNDFRYRSVLGQQMLEFGLLPKPVTGAAYFFNDLKHLVFLRIYYYS